MEQEINWFEHFVLGMRGLQKLSMETPCIALLDDGWVSVHHSLYVNSPNALRLRASTIGREDAIEKLKNIGLVESNAFGIVDRWILPKMKSIADNKS